MSGEWRLMKWTCKKIEVFLDDYLEDKLSVRDKFTYEAHVETCPHCRDYFDHMSAFIEEVRGEAALGMGLRPGEMPQKVLEALARVPAEKQSLLVEAMRRDLEADGKRRKDWMERARARRQPAKAN